MDKEKDFHSEKTENQQTNDYSDKKDQQLETFRVDDTKGDLTTNQGLKMAEDEFSLKAGERGPTLMEDFHSVKK